MVHVVGARRPGGGIILNLFGSVANIAARRQARYRQNSALMSPACKVVRMTRTGKYRKAQTATNN